jgi:hypothetical protein
MSFLNPGDDTVAYLGGLDDDERSMFQSLIAHFVDRLNDERGRSADLTRQLEAMRERISLLEMQAYGASFL